MVACGGPPFRPDINMFINFKGYIYIYIYIYKFVPRLEETFSELMIKSDNNAFVPWPRFFSLKLLPQELELKKHA